MDVWSRIAADLAAVARGEDGAWDRLLVTLDPELEGLARRAPIGRLRNDEDARRDVVASVLGKLHQDNKAAIKKLFALPTPPPVAAWLRLLVRRAAIDVMRGRPEFVRGNAERGPRWLSLATLATGDGAASAPSLATKRREVEDFMARTAAEVRDAIARHGEAAADALAAAWRIAILHTRRLVKRVDVYEGVLAMVLAGHGYAEIAERQDRTVREIELVVGYLEQLFHARGFAGD